MSLRAGLFFFVLLALGVGAVVFGDRLFLGDGPLTMSPELRRRVAGPLEIVEADLRRGPEPGGRLVAVYFDPKELAPSLVLNERAEELSRLAPSALVVMNAGYFTPERRPTGLLVSRGEVLAPFVREGGSAGSGVFVIDHGAASLVARSKVDKGAFTSATLAVQAGPRVIEPGGARGIRSDDGQRANRSVIGKDHKGRVVLAVVVGPAGWSTGPTLFELQAILGAGGLGKGHKDLALESALNLDGGPSTGLHLRVPGHEVHLPETAPVYSVLALEAP